MTYNLNDVIAEAADRAIDSDRIKYPHLFTTQSISDEAIREHQAKLSAGLKSVEHPYQYLGELAKSINKVVRLEETKYSPVSGQFRIVPNRKLKVAGWLNPKKAKIPPVTTVEPDMWMDTTTGELYNKKSARENGIRLPMAKSVSERMLDTVGRIQQCAPSEREFVTYVLKMRNRRGGLVVDLDNVIELWIDHRYPDIRSTDKSRKRKRLAAILEKRRIMINSQTLARDLQILGNPTKQEIIEESARTYNVLPILGALGRSVPAWVETLRVCG